MTYNEVSRQIGFIGYIPFPDVKSLKLLCTRLAMEPDLENYMQALRIYRFCPEAINDEQKIAILLLREVLYHAKTSLWGTSRCESLSKTELNFLK